MSDLKKRWDFERHGPITAEAIAATFEHPGRYRFIYNSYEVGAATPGDGWHGFVHVLSGRGRYTLPGGIKVEIGPGDIFEKPAGPYYFEVLGDEPFERITAWPMPFKMWLENLPKEEAEEEEET